MQPAAGPTSLRQCLPRAAEHSEPRLQGAVTLDERRDEDEPPNAGKTQKARHRLAVLLRLEGARCCAAYSGTGITQRRQDR
jgi:hypothetical protein